jgi:hypothetical protein
MSTPIPFIDPAAQPAFKQFYQNRLQNAAARVNVFAGNTEKIDAHGQTVEHSLKVEYGPAFGAIYAQMLTQLTNVEQDQLFRFSLNIAKDYFLKREQTQTVVLTKENSIVPIMESFIDSGLAKAGNRFEQACWGTGYGMVGVIATVTNTSGTTWTITFDNTNSMAGFGVGYNFVTSSAVAASAIDTGSFTVTSITRATNTIVVTANSGWGGGAGPAIGRVVFALGDKNATGNTTPILAVGVPGWIPLVAPTPGESFFGIDRTADNERLAGTRVDGRGMTIKQAIINAVSAAQNATDGNPDATFDSCYLNHIQVGTLINQEGNRKFDVSKAKEADVMYQGVVIQTPAGKCTVFGSSNVPQNAGWVLSSKTWKIYTPGGTIVRNIIAENPMGAGNLWRVVENDDAIEGRWGWRAAIGCLNPALNAVFQLQ